MGYKFSIFIVTVSIIQSSLCTVNIEAPRRRRQNRFQDSQSEENALDFNTRDGEASPNFDIESFKNQLTSLSPQQIQQIVGLLTPGGATPGPRANDNNVDELKEDNNENVLTNYDNNNNNINRRGPNRRRGGRRNGRRRGRGGRDGCNKNRGGYGSGTGYGMGRGDGNGQGYGSGMGYGSGSGNGEGMGAGSGFGMGQGYGAGNGMGGAGNGSGNGFGAGQGYGSRGGRGSGYGIGRGSGGAGGNMLGFGAGGGYANQRDPYDYDESPGTPSVSGTQGAMIGGGSEISGVKINSFARPVRNGIPSRM